MTIKKLPQYLINQLKAGEIVERPASIVKELIENSLDAGATSLVIEIEQGGKERIIVRDNGTGVSQDDLPKMIERYATSKIHEADDLLSLVSYGFRGEALSAIAEVSDFLVQTKVDGSQAYELKRSDDWKVVPAAFATEHGTHVIVDKLFATIPVREKYLKSVTTEWNYIRQLVTTYALIHYDKQWSLTHNGKKSFHLSPAASLMERAGSLFQQARQEKRVPFEFKDQAVHCWGLRGDASLHFPSSQHVYLIVNGRPVHDKLLRKAVLKAYQRQIVPGTYPFVVLCIDIDPVLVDVNVHPRKLEVKFLDPGSIFTLVQQTVGNSLGDQKVSYSSFKKSPVQYHTSSSFARGSGSHAGSKKRAMGAQESDRLIGSLQQFGERRTERSMNQGIDLPKAQEKTYGGLRLGEYEIQIVGQLMNMYIVAEHQNGMLLIDQHALAERITFEKIRKQIKNNGFEPEILLTPLTISRTLSQEQSDLLNAIGFDVSTLTQTTTVLYAVPKVFQQYSFDIQLLMQCLEGIDVEENAQPYELFEIILNEIVGMKACKASIKAGQRLSKQEMQKLIQDAEGMVEGLFVCQHGRPSVVTIPKQDVDGLFDR